MKKEKLILLVLVMLLPVVTAEMFDTTISSYNDTMIQVSISNTDNLYAYEVRLSYGGSSPSATNIAFLSQCTGPAIGSHIDSTTISVYESCLSSSRVGLSGGSGYVANITHDAGDSLTFCSAAAVNANGTVEYEYDGDCVEDEPSPSPPDGGGGGGGGGAGIAPPTADYVLVTPSLLNVNLRRTVNSQDYSIVVKNNADEDLTITLQPQLISNYIHIDEADLSFVLAPGEVKQIIPTFFASQDADLGSHTGWIDVRSSSENIDEYDKVSVSLSINPLQPLFDVYIELDDDTLSPGDNLGSTVRLLNFGDLRGFDAIIYIAIKNLNNEVITFSEIPVAIDYTYQGIFNLPIPEDTPLGQYVFVAEINYDSTKATGTQQFTIGEARFAPFNKNLFKTLSYTLLLAVISLLFILGIIKLFSKINSIRRIRQQRLSEQVRESIKAQYTNFS